MVKLPMGREVVEGVFSLYDTKGLPITVVLGFLKDHDVQPCWVNFVKEGLSSGWKKETILRRLEEGIVDVYGTSYWIEVRQKLQEVFLW